MTLVLSGCAVLTMDADARLLPAADIHIVGTDIAAIVAPGTGRGDGDEVIDCRDTLVIPGLVNAHTHAATGLLRGLAEDKPRSFWAEYRIPGQDRLTVDDYVASARASCAEFLLNGVTAIADRFGHMDHIGAALETSGIRAILGPTISDASTDADRRCAEAVFERWGSDPAKRISAGLAPHALTPARTTCSAAAPRKPSAIGAASSCTWRRARPKSTGCTPAAMTGPSPACAPMA